jgi:mannose-1-phosphate guanylyltransferase
VTKRYAVIMAGGSGTRLWPMSRSCQPKQLLKLTADGKSLLQTSVRRLRGLFNDEDIYIITAADHVSAIHREIPELPVENLIGEPVGRDTANAIGLSAAILAARSPDSLMGVFTADQLIEPVEQFQLAVKTAFDHIEHHPENLATFGIKPTWPHSGLGYILRGRSIGDSAIPTYQVLAFKEKPDPATARLYVDSGEYYWNSGMFVWKVSTILDHLKHHLPENAEKLIDLGRQFGRDDWTQTVADIYPLLKKISIDFAVMEKAKEVLVVELDCRWADIGSWPELQNITGLDDRGNAILAKCVCTLDSQNNVIVSSQDHHLISLIGVRDCIIVHTLDATLVCPKENAQQIKQLVAQLEERYKKTFV